MGAARRRSPGIPAAGGRAEGLDREALLMQPASWMLAAPPGPLPTGTLWAGQLALSSAPLPGKKVRSRGVSLRAEIMRASGWI